MFENKILKQISYEIDLEISLNSYTTVLEIAPVNEADNALNGDRTNVHLSVSYWILSFGYSEQNFQKQTIPRIKKKPRCEKEIADALLYSPATPMTIAEAFGRNGTVGLAIICRP